MANRTYAEMEKKILDHFANITKEEFVLALKKAKFEFFNQMEVHVVDPSVPEGESHKERPIRFSGSLEGLSTGNLPRLRFDTPLGSDFCWSEPGHSLCKMAA